MLLRCPKITPSEITFWQRFKKLWIIINNNNNRDSQAGPKKIAAVFFCCTLLCKKGFRVSRLPSFRYYTDSLVNVTFGPGKKSCRPKIELTITEILKQAQQNCSSFFLFFLEGFQGFLLCFQEIICNLAPSLPDEKWQIAVYSVFYVCVSEGIRIKDIHWRPKCLGWQAVLLSKIVPGKVGVWLPWWCPALLLPAPGSWGLFLNLIIFS